MIEYPSIIGADKAPHSQCIAFYKYDGTNLRFEWSKKKGWHKFGTRKCMIDESDVHYGQAIPLFKSTIADTLEKIFKDEYRDENSFTIFAEYYGYNSFSGQHKQEDVKKLTLIDVASKNNGFVYPRDFVNNFGGFHFSPQIIYEGNLNEELIMAIREGKYPVVEGVVCKGKIGKDIWMAKIKTDAYREKLKQMYADKWEQFWE